MTIQINAEIDKKDLITAINDSISHEDIIDFIKDLEKSYEDWEVTEKLHEYFKSEMKILKKHEEGIENEQSW